MVRLGKFGENKINFRDSTNGRRGMQWSQNRRDGRYRLFWSGRVPVPARGTATNFGGSARYGLTRGGQSTRQNGGAANSTYLSAAWAHGIASIGGFLVSLRNSLGGQQATDSASYMRSSLVNASTIRVSFNTYTAATQFLDMLVWGSTTLAY